eukprot:scaffold392585_cov22-Prasinocladus_malaysianus.AAC.1
MDATRGRPESAAIHQQLLMLNPLSCLLLLAESFTFQHLKPEHCRHYQCTAANGCSYASSSQNH